MCGKVFEYHPHPSLRLFPLPFQTARAHSQIGSGGTISNPIDVSAAEEPATATALQASLDFEL